MTGVLEVEGDMLAIQLETTTIKGEPITRVLRWRRVALHKTKEAALGAASKF